MAADVAPRRPPSATIDGVDAGTPVRHIQWTRTALIVNHTLGQGAQLVPAYAPTITLADGKTHEFYFRVRPRYQAFERIWSFTLRTDDTGYVTCGVVAPAGGTEVDFGAASDRETAAPREFTESLSAQSDAEGNVSIQFTPSGGDVIIDSLSCREVPRAELTTGTSDDGIDVTKFGTGFPIRAASHANMADVLNDETKIGRRASLWQWAVPSNVNSALTAGFAWTTAATSYQSIFTGGVPVLGRKIGTSDTTASVKCRALAWVDANSASIYFASSINGNSNSTTITATTPTWTTAIDLTVDCDDMASTDGRQTSGTPAWDMMGALVKCASTATTGVYISAISVWED